MSQQKTDKTVSFTTSIADVNPDVLGLFFGGEEKPKPPKRALCVDVKAGRWYTAEAEIESDDDGYSIRAKCWEFYPREGDGFADEPTFVSLLGPLMTESVEKLGG